MRAALAFALRRASARLVCAVAVVGLFVVVYRAVRPLIFTPVAAGPACSICIPGPVSLGSSHWDLAVAALAVVVAAVVAAALYRQVSVRHPLATFRAGRSQAASARRFHLLRRITSHGSTGSAPD